jgi:hypothetical protein
MQLVLLKDAVKQLDEPFLVVVVGEFNSGKSRCVGSCPLFKQQFQKTTISKCTKCILSALATRCCPPLSLSSPLPSTPFVLLFLLLLFALCC